MYLAAVHRSQGRPAGRLQTWNCIIIICSHWRAIMENCWWYYQAKLSPPPPAAARHLQNWQPRSKPAYMRGESWFSNFENGLDGTKSFSGKAPLHQWLKVPSHGRLALTWKRWADEQIWRNTRPEIEDKSRKLARKRVVSRFWWA